MNFEDKDTFADKNGAAKSLAARLVDFYKDYDYYDYQDTLEVGETDEDAIKQKRKDYKSKNFHKS